jgi:RNA-directed DNA polymerase
LGVVIARLHLHYLPQRSPLLANVYLHYVLELWVEVWRKKIACGDVIIVRYADHLVAGFQYQQMQSGFLR